MTLSLIVLTVGLVGFAFVMALIVWYQDKKEKEHKKI
jgi:hypothetical protein